jgi:hypothetical protein
VGTAQRRGSGGKAPSDAPPAPVRALSSAYARAPWSAIAAIDAHQAGEACPGRAAPAWQIEGPPCCLPRVNENTGDSFMRPICAARWCLGAKLLALNAIATACREMMGGRTTRATRPVATLAWRLRHRTHLGGNQPKISQPFGGFALDAVIEALNRPLSNPLPRAWPRGRQLLGAAYPCPAKPLSNLGSASRTPGLARRHQRRPRGCRGGGWVPHPLQRQAAASPAAPCPGSAPGCLAPLSPAAWTPHGRQCLRCRSWRR